MNIKDVKAVTFCFLSAALIFGSSLSIAQVESFKCPKVRAESVYGGVRAPGQPIINCVTVDQFNQDIAEFERRVSDLQKPIDRQQRIIDAAKKGGSEARTEADRIMREAPVGLITSFAKDYLKFSEKLRTDIKPKRKLLKAVLEAEEAAKKVQAAPIATQAGIDFGLKLQNQKDMASLSEKIRRAHKLFVDSGIAKEAASELAGVIFPFGGFAIEAGLIALDLTIKNKEAFIEQDVVRRAQDVQQRIESQQDSYRLAACSLVETREACHPAPTPAQARGKGLGAGAITGIILGIGAGVAVLNEDDDDDNGPVGPVCSSLCSSGDRFCSAFGARVCCPQAFPALCSDGVTCTTIAFGSCPGGGARQVCCPGTTDCTIGC